MKINKKSIQSMVRYAVSRGTLKKPKHCEVCLLKFNSKLISGHHHKGYDHPLEVVWVCHPCHSKLHDQRCLGEKNGVSKLTKENVLSIRQEYNGECGDYTRLAKKYSIEPSSLRGIVKRVTWKHI